MSTLYVPGDIELFDDVTNGINSEQCGRMKARCSRRGSSICEGGSVFTNHHESLPKLDHVTPRHHVGSQSMRGSSDKSDRVTINVGGTRHETFFSTLRMYPDTRLGWIALNSSESMYAYDATLNEYFFDRHPTAFTQIINFYRTGKLHAPADICGPLFEEELQFWGLDEKSMEPCCWSKYTEHRDAQENLKVFDTPLLNPIDEELNIETMYDQQVGQKDDDGREANKFSEFVKHLKPSVFHSIKWFKLKKKVWIAFEDRSPTRTIVPKALSILSLVFIVMSVLSLFFHSMLLLRPNRLHETLLLGVDGVSFLWFTVEFLLRFVSSPNRGAFIMSLTNIVDLLSIVTYPIQFSQGFTYYTNPNETIEILVSFRLFRLFRFLRLSLGLQILKHALIASSKELFLLFLLLIIPVAIFATLTYYIERRVEETKFKTIPESIWWAIITVTTVGYGDMAPLTSLGKVMGTACAICGVVILSLPVSIIGNNFSLFYHYAQARMKLPKRNKAALAGASNIIFAENSNSISSAESGDESETQGKLPQINLGSDPDTNTNITSKRFRRERLSLYVTNKTRTSNRRSRSMGNNNIQQRQRNGRVKTSTNNNNTSDSNSDTESEYHEVFKPMEQSSTMMSYNNKAFAGQEETPKVDTDVEGNAIHDERSTATPLSSECNGKEHHKAIGDKHSVIVNVPETVITCSDATSVEIPCNGISVKDTQKNKTISFQKFSSPPVKAKHADNNKNKTPNTLGVMVNNMSDVDVRDSCNQSNESNYIEAKRKRSNNHLYPPESLDDST